MFIPFQFSFICYLSSWYQSWVTDKELEQKVKELEEWEKELQEQENNLRIAKKEVEDQLRAKKGSGDGGKRDLEAEIVHLRRRLDEFEKEVGQWLQLKRAQQNRERKRMEAEIRVRIEEREREKMRDILKERGKFRRYK